MSRVLTIDDPDAYLVQYKVMERQTARDVFFEVQRRHPELKFLNADPIVKHVGKGFWVDVPVSFRGSAEEVKQKFDESAGEVLYALKVIEVEGPNDEGEA